MSRQGPMLAKVQEAIPEGPGWRYEPKRVAGRSSGVRATCSTSEAATTDRSTATTPRSSDSCSRGGPDHVVDGEIVVVRPEGFGFDELLQRIHPAASRVKMLSEKWPATHIVFDTAVRSLAGGRTAVPRPARSSRSPR